MKDQVKEKLVRADTALKQLQQHLADGMRRFTSPRGATGSSRCRGAKPNESGGH